MLWHANHVIPTQAKRMVDVVKSVEDFEGFGYFMREAYTYLRDYEQLGIPTI